MDIGNGIRRLGGTGSGIVNSYLLEEAGVVTIVDAGMPGQWDALIRELEAMGRGLDDVRGLVLTHGHSDHIGYAERLRRSASTRVLVHELDAALARGTVPNPAKGTGPIRPLPMLRFLVLGLRLRAIRTPFLTEVGTFGDGATLDLPGTPRVVLVPGHTPGSAALHVPSRDAVLVGDALATYSATTGERGPQIAPFTADRAEALRSLDRLRAVQARLVLPGHGDPWDGGVEEAVSRVRAPA